MGQVLCRPDDDETKPSLLERIVDKSRDITDLIVENKAKFKDSLVRHINEPKDSLKLQNSPTRQRMNSSCIGSGSKFDASKIKLG